MTFNHTLIGGWGTIAALFVQPRGCYHGVSGVDLWPEKRDARLYCGPWPVVAHPPCARWCQLAGLVQVRWGKRQGDDGGCFASALTSVRAFGGVLEHPAFTRAFAAHGLPDPPAEGWQRTLCGGFVCHVEQGHYGHRAPKATWLYAHGVKSLPSLRWGRCGNHINGKAVERMGKRERNATPEQFRDALIGIARSVSQRAVAA